MRAFFRPVTTLLLAPILFVAVMAYVNAQTSGTAGMLPAILAELKEIYTIFTLPALVLMLVVLLPIDLLLRRTGFGLLTVAVSPLVAAGIALLLRRFVSEPHVQHLAAAAVGLFFVYGLTWGLTIRDPRTVVSA